MDEKRRFGTDELIELSAAARMAEKLAAHVLHVQREIAVILSGVEAMAWPTNLMGRMQTSLERRDYGEIEKMLAEWHKWMNEELPTIKDRLSELETLIRAFVVYFKNTNGG